MTQIGNENELFFNRESKSGTWEITFDSTNDKVLIEFYRGKITHKTFHIICNKKEFVELKKFIKNMRLKKNYKMKLNLNALKT